MRTLTETAETQSEALGRINGDLDALVWDLDEGLRQVRGGHMAEAELEPLVTRARAVLLAGLYDSHRYMK